MSEVRKLDQELFQTYQTTKDPYDLHRLVTQLMPLIHTEVKRASGTLPTQALTSEAKKWTIHAINTYDPSKGTQLSTHVTNYLQKVRRMNYRYQNAARLSENNQLIFHKYNNAQQGLSERLSRDPSDEEMAAELGWSKKAVIKFKSGIFQDIVESSKEKASEYSRFDTGRPLFEHMMDQLSPEEQLIMKHTGDMTSNELAAKLGVNVNRLNYLKGKMVKKLKGIQNEMVRYQ
jgi:DNA-directed RNA polymerase specialized sigma subunit